MSDCPKCGKPVYFAERRSSVGYDWHRECLRCGQCSKVLNPGQHAEHKGEPYCHVPCYSALFGPSLYGHGSKVEMHTFGEKPMINQQELERKVQIYNQYYAGPYNQISTTEVSNDGILTADTKNGRLIIEGLLKIYWGVTKPIFLKRSDDVPIPRRRASCFLLDNAEPTSPTRSAMLQSKPSSSIKDRRPRRIRSTDDLEDAPPSSPTPLGMKHRSATVGRRQGKSTAIRKRYSINGYIYNPTTSIFTPQFATITTVRASNLLTTVEVIKILLEKFRVENNPREYSLYIVKENGETKQLLDCDCPLLSRVMLGPSEEVAKLFIMEKDSLTDLPLEIAQYLNLSLVELRSILRKFDEEEEREENKIIGRYTQLKQVIMQLLNEKRIPNQPSTETGTSEMSKNIHSEVNQSLREPDNQRNQSQGDAECMPQFYTPKSDIDNAVHQRTKLSDDESDLPFTTAFTSDVKTWRQRSDVMPEQFFDAKTEPAAAEASG